MGGKAFLPAVTLYRSANVAAIAYVVRDRPGEDDAEARATYQALQQAVSGVVANTEQAGYSSTAHDHMYAFDSRSSAGSGGGTPKAPNDSGTPVPPESAAAAAAANTQGGGPKARLPPASASTSSKTAAGSVITGDGKGPSRFQRVQMASGRSLDEDDGGDPDETYLVSSDLGNQEYEATPMWQQALGVFIMRWQLLARIGCLCICVLCTVFVVGILVVVFASPSTSPIPGMLTRCPGGFYANTPDTCSRELFVSELTTSLWRTLEKADLNERGPSVSSDWEVSRGAAAGLEDARV